MTSVLAAVDAAPAAPPEVQELFGATVAALPVDAGNAAAEIARRRRHVADGVARPTPPVAPQRAGRPAA